MFTRRLTALWAAESAGFPQGLRASLVLAMLGFGSSCSDDSGSPTEMTGPGEQTTQTSRRWLRGCPAVEASAPTVHGGATT